MSDDFFWEASKAARVLAERGLSFAEVKTVFAAPREDIMQPEIYLIEDEDYPADDLAPEYDFAELHRRAQAEGREYRGVLAGRGIRLAPEVAAAFPTAEAVNEALRKLMREAA